MSPSLRSPSECMKLRACWVTHTPVGCPGDAEDVDSPGADLEDEEHLDTPKHHGVRQTQPIQIAVLRQRCARPHLELLGRHRRRGHQCGPPAGGVT